MDPRRGFNPCSVVQKPLASQRLQPKHTQVLRQRVCSGQFSKLLKRQDHFDLRMSTPIHLTSNLCCQKVASRKDLKNLPTKDMPCHCLNASGGGKKASGDMEKLRFCLSTALCECHRPVVLKPQIGVVCCNSSSAQMPKAEERKPKGRLLQI